MPKVEWTNEFSVYCGSFDDEHKKLVGIINKLSDAMAIGQGKDMMNKILSELTEYAQTHFKHEEVAMEQYDFPGFAEHKKEHTDFVKKLLDVYKDFQAGNLSISITVFNFLVSWLQNHIMKSDKAYGEFFVSIGKADVV